MMLTDITYLDLEFICLNMRDCDKREIFALRPHDNPLQLAMEAHAVIKNQGRGRIAWIKGRPAGMAAFTEDWPGVWSIWMFGTDDFKAAAIPLIRWARAEAVNILSICKGHRCQADSHVDHHEAHKLLAAAGARPEFTMRRYGKDGGDYIRWVWLNGEDDAVLKPHFVRADKEEAA